MKLYFAPGACSLAVHIALREAELPHTLVRVDLATHTLADGSDYKRIQPRGYVPLLEFDDGSRHSEASALLLHVGELDPHARLLPAAGTRARFEVQQWLAFVATELHKTFSPWLWHKDTADSTRKAVKDKLAARFAELDAHLRKRDVLVGERFTVADAYAFTIVRWSDMLGLDLKPYPALRAYLSRIGERPAVQEALRAEELAKA